MKPKSRKKLRKKRIKKKTTKGALRVSGIWFLKFDGETGYLVIFGTFIYHNQDTEIRVVLKRKNNTLERQNTVINKNIEIKHQKEIIKKDKKELERVKEC